MNNTPSLKSFFQVIKLRSPLHNLSLTSILGQSINKSSPAIQMCFPYEGRTIPSACASSNDGEKAISKVPGAVLLLSITAACPCRWH